MYRKKEQWKAKKNREEKAVASVKSHGQRLGGSWACLPPVYKCNHPATVCDTCRIHPKQHTKKRGALRNIKMTKITRRARTWGRSVWKRPKRKHSEWKEPPLEGTSHHRWNNSAERPWGSWACLPPVLQLGVKSPSHRLWHVHYPWKAH